MTKRASSLSNCNMSDLKNHRGRGLVCLLGLMLAFGTLACYWPARQFDFVSLDDPIYVYRTRMVTQGLSWPGIVWAFQCVQGGNWNPLVWLSHMADCDLYGSKAGGHHVTNLLLHTANALLLFLVFKYMTGAIWRSAFVAAIFAWHPMHVESVAWISERKDVLSTLFLLLTIWAYASFSKAAIPRRKMFYVLALFLFSLGLMCKAMLVTLPLVFLLLDYWPLQRTESAGRLVIEKAPFLVLSLAASGLAVWAQRSTGALGTAPLPDRLENAVVSYAMYIGYLFWPVHLAVFYPFPDSISIWQTGGAVLLLGAISWVVIWGMKKRPYLSMGWFWFLGTLVPVIGLVQVGMQSRADRYTYVPYIGLAVMLSWGVVDLAQAWPRSRAALTAVAALALGCCLTATCSQVKYWRDSTTLYEHALKVTTGNYLVNENLGIFMGMNGNIDQSVKYLQESIRLNPKVASPYYNLGKAYALQHRMDDAVVVSKEAVRLAPNDPKGLNNLAWLYATCPKAEFRDGAEAVRLASRACEITKQPEPEYLDTLAAAYAEAGRFNEAIKTTEEIRALAELDHDTRMTDMALQRLTLYKAGKPFRDEE
jgi:protein O-mannosyl-transferase